MRRFRVVTLLLGLILAGYLLQGPGVRWVVERGFRDNLLVVAGSPMSAESVLHSPGHLEFTNVILKRPVSEDSSGHLITADRVTMDYSLDWWNRVMVSKVRIEGATWQCWIRGSDPLPPVIVAEPPPGWFATEGEVAVEGATIELTRSSQMGEVLQRLFVDGTATIAKDWKAQLTVSANGDAHPDQTIAVSLQGGTHETTGELIVNGVPCNEFARFCHFLYGEPLEALTFQEGKVDGQLTLVVPPGGKPYLEGDLRFAGVAFEQPVWGVHGKVGLARIRLHENTGGAVPVGQGAALGQLEIVEDGFIEFAPEGARGWSVQQLAGGVFLYAEGPSQVKLSGVFTMNQEKAQLTVEGNALLLDPLTPYLDLQMKLESTSRPRADVRLVARQMAPEHKRWEFQCRNMGPQHSEIFRSTLSSWIPQLNQVQLREGRINGSLAIDVMGTSIKEVSVEGLEAQDLVIDCPQWGVSGRSTYVGGRCGVDFTSDNPLGTANADLVIIKGGLWPQGTAASPWKIEEIETRLTVIDGVFQTSIAKALFAGLRGEFALDWRSPQDIVSYNLEGEGSQFAHWLPAPLNEKILGAFGKDRIELKGGLRRYSGGVMVHGSIAVAGADGAGESITFGWDLDQVNPSLWRRDNGLTDEWRAAGHQLVRELTPQTLRPAAETLTHWLDVEQGTWGAVARKGWFKADQLRLEKYVAPVIFDSDTKMQLTGLAKLDGQLEGTQAVLRFSARNVRLQSPALDIFAADIGSADDLIAGTALPGRYYVNLKTGHHFGWVPVHGATYLEKASDIHFSDVDSLVLLGDRAAHAVDLNATAEGVYFAGAVDVVGNDAHNGVTVTVKSREVSGDIPGVRRLLHRVDSEFIGSIPLDGRVTSGPGEGSLVVAVAGEVCTVTAGVKGRITQGTLNSESGLLSLQGVACDFDYNFDNNALSFNHLQGRALVGDSSNGDEYTLGSQEIRLFNFPDTHVEFDVRAEDATRDYVRLNGEGISERTEKNERVVRLVLNKETSHIGAVHPNITQCVIKDWSEILALRADPVLDLTSLPSECTKLVKTGWFSMRPAEVDFLTGLELSGEVCGKLDYEPQEKKVVFTATGDKIAIRNRVYGDSSLSGSYSKGVWTIDQLQLDELSIAADLSRQEKSWHLGFFGITYGSTLMAGMKGDYFPETKELKAAVDVLELKFDGDQPPRDLKPYIEQYKPTGQLRGSGEVTLSFADTSRWCDILADIKATPTDFSISGVRLADHQVLRTHYSSAEGFVVNNLQVVVEKETSGDKGMGLAISQLRYQPETEMLDVQRAGLSVPAENLAWLMERLQQRHPGQISARTVDLISHLKSEGNLSAVANFSTTPSDRRVRLDFSDDTYHFFDGDHALRDLFLEITGDNIHIGTIYRFKDHDLGILAETSAASAHDGLLAISSSGTIPESIDGKDHLQIQWTNNEERGFNLRRASGTFSGLNVDLATESQKTTADTLVLTGQIGGDISAARWLLPDAVSAAIDRWQISSGLMIGGRFDVNKADPTSVNFLGNLSGTDFYLKGYQLDSLFARVNYSPTQLNLQELRISDPVLTINVEGLTAEKQPDSSWRVNMPLLVAKDIKPDLLRTSDERKDDAGNRIRHLLIKKLEIRDLAGNPAETGSWTGSASLSFVNPSVTDSPWTIFDIPKELIARIGLTTSVLNPVTGTIVADIHNGRVNVTELRDVYSDDQASAFVLADDGEPSFMDFDGHLNVRVRMKQYNLLFKFTELFTISVIGTLEDPKYSLAKQPTPADPES